MSLLKKTTVAILGTAVVLTASAGAFAHDKKGGDREGRGSMHMFERADANSDEKLDFVEFSTPMTERFDELDADSNGIITEAEIDAASEGKGRRAERIAKRLDGDDNGEITKAELEERQKAMFARLDVDEDGFVTLDEAKKMKRGGGKRGGKRGGGDRT